MEGQNMSEIFEYNPSQNPFFENPHSKEDDFPCNPFFSKKITGKKPPNKEVIKLGNRLYPKCRILHNKNIKQVFIKYLFFILSPIIILIELSSNYSHYLKKR